jgi:hypothetical protein
LLTGIDPGEYMLYGVSDWMGEREEIEKARWATVAVTITDRNVEARLVLHPGLAVEGRILSEEDPNPGVKGPYGQDQIEIGSGFIIQSGEQFVRYSAGGFEMRVFPGPQRILVNAGRLWYVRDIRYNRMPLPGSKIPFNPGVGTHQLDIVLDNQPAVVTGTARPGAVVWLLRSPGDLTEAVRAGSDGTFALRPVIPGEYRIFAVREEQQSLLEQPGVFERMFARGQSLSLKRGELKLVTLELADAY